MQHGGDGVGAALGVVDVGLRQQTALDLQILHVAGFVESTGIDATSYLPWNAPLAWQGRTQPYYQVLLQSLLTQHGQAPGCMPVSAKRRE